MPEQELRDVFGRAVGDAAPDLGLLIAGAAAEGRALRARRRVALAGTVAAVAALAVAGGLLLRPTAPAVTAAAGPETLAPVPAASISLPPGKTLLTGPAAFHTLLSLLPEGLGADGWTDDSASARGRVAVVVRASLRHERTASAADGSSYGDVGASDGGVGGTEAGAVAGSGPESGSGAGTVEARIQYPATPPQGSAGGYDCAGHPATEDCAPITARPGTTGVVTTARDASHRIVRRVDLLTPDGVRVVLLATGTAERAPLIDRDTLLKMALSPTWQPVIGLDEARAAAQKFPTGPRPGSSPAPDATVLGGPQAAVGGGLR
ncbi:hypothetical protein [Streptomyces sp. TLI_171]|uniref:hypothetical protein n=1 Tax=Streptomyces sp. TLI_171 TaxID=1938859 RepID=UPI000C186C42|nr:hypothetical protein [Streptomyces sp. TLI_171]RKE19113.1 hypothetical protein BX266_2420 [Streptomyces sp. TLI_171]